MRTGEEVYINHKEFEGRAVCEAWIGTYPDIKADNLITNRIDELMVQIMDTRHLSKSFCLHRV